MARQPILGVMLNIWEMDLGSMRRSGTFFLGYDAGCVRAAEGDSCEARGGCCGFECVFHLIEASLWREDGDVVIIV